jgi:DNA-directed RNA polymerase subunit RPC12/RpoP
MKLVLVGEGDFSFTSSISRLLNERRFEALSFLLGQSVDDLAKAECTELIATSLDSKQEVLNKYPSFISHSLTDHVRVHHSVNALDALGLRKLTGSEPQFILWNHPHLGHEDCENHFQLLVHFFRGIADVFPTSSIILSLLSDQIPRWRVEEACGKRYRVTRIFPLNESDFPGFICRRNLAGDSFKSSRTRANWGQSELKSHFLVFEPLASSIKPSINIRAYLSTPAVAVPEREFMCEICEKRFSSDQGLRTHVRQVHQLGKYSTGEFVCATCEKIFNSSESLRMHSLNTHGQRSAKRQRFEDSIPTDSDYKCEICGSRDPNHVEKFGKNEIKETLRCGHCSKEFHSERALVQHTNVSHPSNS